MSRKRLAVIAFMAAGLLLSAGLAAQPLLGRGHGLVSGYAAKVSGTDSPIIPPCPSPGRACSSGPPTAARPWNGRPPRRPPPLPACSLLRLAGRHRLVAGQGELRPGRQWRPEIHLLGRRCRRVVARSRRRLDPAVPQGHGRPARRPLRVHGPDAPGQAHQSRPAAVPQSDRRQVREDLLVHDLQAPPGGGPELQGPARRARHQGRPRSARDRRHPPFRGAGRGQDIHRRGAPRRDRGRLRVQPRADPAAPRRERTKLDYRSRSPDGPGRETSN
jgi:hypothetical protein